jgi:hypothetical protein
VPQVADAIFETSLPRSAGDSLPKTDAGVVLAVADRYLTNDSWVLTDNLNLLYCKRYNSYGTKFYITSMSEEYCICCSKKLKI